MLEIIEGDITKMHADVIVNAANFRLKQGGGVCGAIFRAAGASNLRHACKEIGYCKTGEAVITPGFNLSKYIIHTPGAKWSGGHNDELDLLKKCYENSLKLAAQSDCKSIAFPLISAGIYGCPKDIALQIAKEAINEFLSKSGSNIKVYLVIKKMRL